MARSPLGFFAGDNIFVKFMYGSSFLAYSFGVYPTGPVVVRLGVGTASAHVWLGV